MLKTILMIIPFAAMTSLSVSVPCNKGVFHEVLYLLWWRQ